MNSSQLSRSRSDVDSCMPRPITCLPFSLSLDTSGEKSESPETTTNVLICSFEYARSMASTHRRMSAEFLPVWLRRGNCDKLDGRLVQRGRVRPKAAPVGVRFLGHDLAFFHEALQHALDVEAIP